MPRCDWAATEPMIAYHDREWGVPVREERGLFELLVLEGAQAGLSWETILKKRPAYRLAFEGFDPERVARFGPEKVQSLLEDPGIVRNRLKVASAVANARALLALREQPGGAAGFLWQFVGGVPRQNARRSRAELPARTAESDAMSKELKRRGFGFVGSTICYAFMQAAGMVNDHFESCFRHAELRDGGGHGGLARD